MEGALSSLMRFGQCPLWSPVVTVSQSAILKNALVQMTRRNALHRTSGRSFLNSRRLPTATSRSSANSRRQFASISHLSASARRQLMEILAKRRRNQAIIARQRSASRRQLQAIRNRLLQRHLRNNRRNVASQHRIAPNINRRPFPISRTNSRNGGSLFGNSDIGTGDVFANPGPKQSPQNSISSHGAPDPFIPVGSVNQAIPVATVDQGLLNAGIIVPQIAFLPPDIVVSRQPLHAVPGVAPTNPPVRQKTALDKAIELYLMDELGIDPPDPVEVVPKVTKARPKVIRKPQQRKTTVVIRPLVNKQPLPTTPVHVHVTKPVPTALAISELSRIAMVSTETPLRIILSTHQKTTRPTTPRPPVTNTVRRITIPAGGQNKPPMVIHNNDHVLITPNGTFTIQLANNTSTGTSNGFKIVR
ncbi:hypothetical protein FSP39_011516 [Pinctada imbricata]|uniref:Uncharacterized protein n=1 Tax=Pinctada imbricata TaxID=66713 RepID=A0AA89BUJ9_PINIB|nr:hypothetical protein FSP39_011516 [Pinctada imbricata]